MSKRYSLAEAKNRLADPGASARLVSSLLRVRSAVVVRAGAPERPDSPATVAGRKQSRPLERRGRPRRPIWLPAVIHEAEGGESIEITRHGRAVAVVLSMAEYERLRGAHAGHVGGLPGLAGERVRPHRRGRRRARGRDTEPPARDEGGLVTARFLLDTDAIREPLCPAQNPAFLARYRLHIASLMIASPAWRECLYGLYRMAPGRKREAVNAFLHGVLLPTVDILPYDMDAARWHAAERARLEREGRATPFADGMIAAVGARLGLTIVTQNRRDFEAFASVVVTDWWEP